VIQDGDLLREYITGMKEDSSLNNWKGKGKAREKGLKWETTCHSSSKKVAWLVRQQFVWPVMFKDIKAYCKGCLLCKRARKPGQKKPAIATPFGKIENTHMPFGMRNAPAFQSLINILLDGCQECSCAYLDDVLIFSISWEDHVHHVAEVFKKIKQAGLTVKRRKYSWEKGKVEYLGLWVGSDMVEVPKARMAALLEYQHPRTQKPLS